MTITVTWRGCHTLYIYIYIHVFTPEVVTDPLQHLRPLQPKSNKLLIPKPRQDLKRPCNQGKPGDESKKLNSLRIWLPSLKLTRPLKIDPWKRRFLLETIIFRGYVSFREGSLIEMGATQSTSWHPPRFMRHANETSSEMQMLWTNPPQKRVHNPKIEPLPHLLNMRDL